MKTKFAILALALALVFAGCSGCGGGGSDAQTISVSAPTVPSAPILPAYSTTLGVAEYNFENTVIKTNVVPSSDFYKQLATFWGLGTLAPMIPAFDGKGLLIASWTPSNKPNAPTFVLAHGGGGGIGATEFILGADLISRTGANILIVDSTWSRGRISNGGDSIPTSGKTMSSNARMFDLVAAGRWLATQGVDPKRTYAIGMSQGGWGVLRAFTNDPMITELVKPYYAGGVSLYPMCEEPGTKHLSVPADAYVYHKLGPYSFYIVLHLYMYNHFQKA
jgi:dienelactone hydrolase